MHEKKFLKPCSVQLHCTLSAVQLRSTQKLRKKRGRRNGDLFRNYSVLKRTIGAIIILLKSPESQSVLIDGRALVWKETPGRKAGVLIPIFFALSPEELSAYVPKNISNGVPKSLVFRYYAVSMKYSCPTFVFKIALSL